MKLLTVLLVLCVSSVSFANRGARDGGGSKPRSQGQTRTFSPKVSDILAYTGGMFGRTYAFESVRKAPESVQKTFENKMTALEAVLRSKRSELEGNEIRKQEVAAILEGIETAYTVRAKILTLAKGLKNKNQQDQAEELLGLIDHYVTILEAKIKDSVDAPEMSFDKIMQSLNAINKAELRSGEDIVALADAVTKIIGPIRRARRCRA